ncbi:MAG: MarR family winged helix-turn-helix transcriptional regulator [Dehalococcoidia bacterium]
MNEEPSKPPGQRKATTHRERSTERPLRTPRVPARDDSSVFGIAQDYKGIYSWVDQSAMEANMAVHAGYWAAHEAGKKLISAIGQGRTAGRFTVLRILFLTEGHCLTQNEVSKRLMITAATVTYLIDGLVKEGLVERRTHVQDRRTIEVILTDRGEEVCLRLIPAMARLAATFCRGFSEKEKQTLVSLMLRFWQNANTGATSESEIAAILAETD